MRNAIHGALLYAGLTFLCLSGAESAISYSFTGKWYSSSGEPMYPQGVAVDSKGNVFVTDLNTHSVHRFDSDGKFLFKWGARGSRDGEFNNPRFVAVDQRGNVYVVDSANERIQRFDSAGEFLGKWGSHGSGDGEFDQPMGVAIDSKGAVYVADLFNGRVQKFDSEGRFLMKFGKKGRGDGELAGPKDVAVDSAGNLYVVDSPRDTIQKFDSGGTFRLKWGSRGTGDGQFRDPNGVTADAEGNVFVADMGNSRIQMFDSQGQLLTKWGTKGSGDGEFDWPHDVAVASDGTVLVADGHNTRIQKFRPAGQKKTGERKGLTVENVVMLKELGLDDGTILQKLSDTGTAFSAQEIQELKKAGFSDEFLSEVQKPGEPAKKPAEPEKDKLRLISGLVLLKRLGVSEDAILKKVEERGIVFASGDAILLERGDFSDEFIRKLCPKWVRTEKPKEDKKEEKKPAEKGLAGTWKMKAKEAEIELVLASDGSFHWNSESGKEVMDFKGVWKKVDDESISMKAEGNPLGNLVPCKLVDADTLEIKLQGITLQFKREEE
jgi:DNA-binding beta-propeller fold protein YncE